MNSNSTPGVRLVPRDNPSTAGQAQTIGDAQRKLHRTSGIERKHRDNGWCSVTKVAPRDERGEVVD